MDAGVSPEGLRLDGRRACELRRLRCSLGVLPDADGSALLCAGGTRALAAAYGPREAGGGAARDGAAAGCTLTVELTHACVASGEPRRGPRRDRRAAEEGAALRECLLGAVLASLLPRTTLHVAVSLLSVDGGSFAAAFNAALLALAHAGVPLRDTAGAGGAALLRGVACADPCRQEEARGTEATAVVLPGRRARGGGGGETRESEGERGRRRMRPRPRACPPDRPRLCPLPLSPAAGCCGCRSASSAAARPTRSGWRLRRLTPRPRRPPG